MSELSFAQPVVDCIRIRLNNRGYQVVAVYGFGSYFTGQQGQDSDVDIAVICRSVLSSRDLWDICSEASSLLGRDADIIDILRANTAFRAEIIATGRRLYCADETVADLFETYAFASFARLNESRREILDDILKRKSVYGR